MENIIEDLAMAVTHSKQGEYAKNEKFVRKAIAELLDEMVGVDRKIPDDVVTREMMIDDNAYNAFEERLKSYNQAKAEIRERIKKILK